MVKIGNILIVKILRNQSFNKLSNSLISLEFETGTLSEGDYYVFQLT